MGQPSGNNLERGREIERVTFGQEAVVQFLEDLPYAEITRHPPTKENPVWAVAGQHDGTWHWRASLRLPSPRLSRLDLFPALAMRLC